MAIPNEVKNIIFDLGGVILNLDFARTGSAFATHGVENFDRYFTPAGQNRLFDSFEIGTITAQEFRTALLKEWSKEIAADHFKAAWNAMLLDIPASRIALLQALRKRYRLFLLSNTNETHIDFVERYLEREFGIPSLNQLFEHAYYSFKMGKRKPHPEIFAEVLRTESLLPHETIFLDDSKANLEGARAVGMHVLHIDKSDEICELLGSHIL